MYKYVTIQYYSFVQKYKYKKPSIAIGWACLDMLIITYLKYGFLATTKSPKNLMK